jgi:hypothetical protein
VKTAAFIALTLGTFLPLAALDNRGNAVYFETIFPAFGTEEEALSALKADPEGRDTDLKAGNYYWMLGTSEKTQAASKRALCRKAADILEGCWKRNKRDDEVCLSLGYAYTGIAGATPMSELEALLSAINKAQNLWGMVVARLPRNIDARLARTLINMNYTPQNGRPDALILEDANVYFQGYSSMSEGMQKQPYYYMGSMEMRLARALVLHDQGRKAEARILVNEIDETVLAKHFLTLLAPLKKAYGK